MKTSTLKILKVQYDSVNKTIKEYVGSLLLAKNNPHLFREDSIAVLRDKLSAFNATKRELKASIEWVKSIDKREIVIPTKKNNHVPSRLHHKSS